MKRRFQQLIALLVAVIVPAQVSAVQILPECASGTGLGDCNTCDFLALFANLSELILAFLGGGVILMVVTGGFLWVLSGGNDKLVQKGKEILIGAGVGTMIVLGAYFVINTVIASLTGDGDFQNVQLYGTNWATFCGATNETRGEEIAPATSDEDCSSRFDGTRCSTSGCTENCQCLDGACVPACQVTWQEEVTSCVREESDCGNFIGDADPDTGTFNGGEGLCPLATPVCCVDPGALTNAEVAAETGCDVTPEGESCETSDCAVGCVCDSRQNCVPFCSYTYTNDETSGVCTDGDLCSEVEGVEEGQGQAYGCPSDQVCCIAPN